MPWKNGGGTTAEIALWPPGASLDNFNCRVSVADVRTDGPFSHFAGIDRKLALLKGALSLTIEGQGIIALTSESPPLEFPGDVKTEAVLASGAAQDLNVMTRRGAATSTMTRQTSAGPIISDPRASICIVYLLSAAAVIDGNAEISLEPGDVVMFTPKETLNLRDEAQFYRIEFVTNV
jgi:environmental stress-induced protein Ves